MKGDWEISNQRDPHVPMIPSTVSAYVCFLAKSLRAAFILESVLGCMINYSHSSQNSSEFTLWQRDRGLNVSHARDMPGGNGFNTAGCVCVGGVTGDNTLIHLQYCGMVLCPKTRSQERISPLLIQPVTECYSR